MVRYGRMDMPLQQLLPESCAEKHTDEFCREVVSTIKKEQSDRLEKERKLASGNKQMRS